MRERVLLSPWGFSIDIVNKKEISYSLNNKQVDKLSTVIQTNNRLYISGGVTYTEYTQEYRSIFYSADLQGIYSLLASMKKGRRLPALSATPSFIIAIGGLEGSSSLDTA